MFWKLGIHREKFSILNNRRASRIIYLEWNVVENIPCRTDHLVHCCTFPALASQCSCHTGAVVPLFICCINGTLLLTEMMSHGSCQYNFLIHFCFAAHKPWNYFCARKRTWTSFILPPGVPFVFDALHFFLDALTKKINWVLLSCTRFRLTEENTRVCSLQQCVAGVCEHCLLCVRASVCFLRWF